MTSKGFLWTKTLYLLGRGLRLSGLEEGSCRTVMGYKDAPVHMEDLSWIG